MKEESQVAAEPEAVEEEEAEEETSQRVSPMEKIATSLGSVVSLCILFSPQVALDPGVTALGVVVVGAAAFCWDVYGRPLLRAASLHSE